MKTDDYISNLLQDIVSDLAPDEMKEEAKRWFTLHIFQREDGSWKSLCDEADDVETDEIEKRVLDWVNRRSGEEWEGKPKEYGAGVCYGVVQDNIADHRLGSDGKKKTLLWLICIGEKNESLSILAAVILETLAPKYDNMLLLEDMKSVYEDRSEKHAIKKKFFFDDISDKEKLRNQYIKQVKEKYKLPEFQLLCHLASMRYETRQNHTMLYFSEKQQSAGVRFDQQKLEFKYVEHLRAIRKIMEIAGNEGAVYIQQPEMRVSGVIPVKEFGGLAVKFKGDAEWSLSKDQQEVLIYRRGEYLIPIFASKWEQELEKLEQLRRDLSDKKLERIKQIIRNEKDNSPHGTSIVFMEGEALRKEIEDRFAKNGYTIKVKPFSLKGNKRNQAMLRGVSAIDGAILSDLNGNCLAIGTIVDGEFVGPGNPGRGARYNSVRNYVQWYKNYHRDTICFAVIISEDGMIDVEIPTVK